MLIFSFLLGFSGFCCIQCYLFISHHKLHILRQPFHVETNNRYMMVRLNNRLDNKTPMRNIREGRVEISFNFGKSWGTICSSHWSFREANVICKQLNLGYAATTGQTQQYGKRNKYPWNMIGVLCRGTEQSLRDCLIESQNPGSCSASNENLAVVTCVEKMTDLQLDVEKIQESAYLDIQPISSLTCAKEEKCFSADAYQTPHTAERKLLRFTTRAENVGTADFSPYANYAQWLWHECHQHFHSMDYFATFDVFNVTNHKIAEGHKPSFCLMDSGCKSGITPKFACGNRTQGISIGCWDTYSSGLDCQWVDVTTLPVNNTYLLRVAINPEYMINEITFENNGVECQLYYTGERSTTYITNCNRTPLWYNK